MSNANQASSNNSSILIWILALFCFVLGSSQQYLMGVPDQIAADTGVSLSAISLLMTAFGLVNAIFAPLFLIATSRFSQRDQLVMASVLVAVGLAIMGVSNVFSLLLVARGILGVGFGAFVATAYSFAQKLAQPGKQATAMANVALGFSAASVLAMPIARALRDVISWHLAYLLLAVLAIAGVAIIKTFFPSVKTANNSVTLKERMSPLANKAVLLAFLCSFFVFVSLSSFYTYITPFIDTTMPELGSGTSVVLFALGIMSLIGTKLCGVISDTLGIRIAIMFSLIGQGVSLIVILLMMNAGFALIPFLLMWMLASWMLVPVQNVLLTRLAKEGAAMAISLANSFQQFGNAFGAVLAGGLITVAPLTSLPMISIPAVAIAIVVELGAFYLGGVKERPAQRW